MGDRPGRRVKARAGVTACPFGLKFFTERAGCTWRRKERGDAGMGVVTGASPAAVPGGAVRAVELAMTCASCAARVEKKLSKLDGVTGDGQLRRRDGPGEFPARLPRRARPHLS
jgi:hypothetical protein